MQKLGLSQNLQQKLSPQQIQFIKLLQVPTAELEGRIEEELEINPALEEGEDQEKPDANEEQEKPEETPATDEETPEASSSEDEVDIKDYLADDDYSGYKMQGDGDEEDREMPIPMSTSLHEQLMGQLDFLGLNEHHYAIGKQLIGSIEADGYIRRDLEAIVNDLAFSQGIDTTAEEVESVLKKIQTFDPPGIAARNLQECLLLQLDRMDNGHDIDVAVAKKIIAECFEEFTKKHYQKIQKKLDTEDEDFVRDAMELIIKLNPKPGGGSGPTATKNQYIIPDYILTNNNGKLELTLNSKNAPDLRISRSYADMFKAYDKSNKKDKKMKEAVTFVKQKLDAAKWFIDAIKQRQQTLLKTMKAIIQYQYEFFLTGDEKSLKPMILKDIADRIGMDISTVSRVANSKYVQTEHGTYLLKSFFSEAIQTESGEEVSNKEVKKILEEHIGKEDKRHPLADEKLTEILKDAGYNIARRT